MESKRERRKLWWAIVASLFVHFIVAYSLAAFGGAFSPATPEEDKPTELTFVDLSETPSRAVVPPNPAYIETDASKESVQPPTEKTFESNANSIAASQLPAAGEAPVPTQEGKDRPFMNLETQQYSLGTERSQAQTQPETKTVPSPSAPTPPPPTAAPKPSEAPKATPTPAPIATPEPEQFAMLTATPPPPIAPDEAEASPTPEIAASAPPPIPRPQPERPSTSFQSEKQATRVTGRITNRGPASVNAVGTPLGRYQKAISDAIGSRWYYYMKSKMDVVSIGTAHVEAEVDAQGHIQKLRVLSNNANEAFANICLQSFQEAHLPPIPPDLVVTLPDGKMPVDIFFTTYAN